MTVRDARYLPRGRSIVEIEYHDPNRDTDYLDGIHQILMISDDHFTVTHGTEIAVLPYQVVKEIRVRFKDDSSQEL